jgi:hypothetical protein
MDTLTAPTNLVVYDKMITAIDQCYRVDEVKDIRDQALALEHYARQAMNVEAERKAIEIRIRAERHAGKLLKELERSPVAHGGNSGKNQHGEYEAAVHGGMPPSEYQEEKRKANISDTQAHRWQKLAEIPHVDFENKLQDPLTKPTTIGLLNGNGNQSKQAPDDALWLWGRLRDFERNQFSFTSDINEVVGKMSDAMQSDVRRIVPQFIDWLGALEEI